MYRRFLAATVITASLAIGCVSSESETLRKTREIQSSVVKDAGAFDSLLLADIQAMNLKREEMSQDTLMATDSLKQVAYRNHKIKIIELEGLQAEVNAWRNSLVLLPSKEEMAKGAKNPFGQSLSDLEVQSKIKAYQDKLSEFRGRAEQIYSQP